jgi:hypothetical protein
MPPTKKKIIEREIIDDDESLDGEEIAPMETHEEVEEPPKTTKPKPIKKTQTDINKTNRIKKANEIRLQRVEEKRLEEAIKNRVKEKLKVEDEKKILEEKFNMKVREEVERLMNTKQKSAEENINLESKPIKTKPTKAKKPVQEPLKQEYPQQPNDDLEPYMLYRNLFM